MPNTILHVDASARHEGSLTREVGAFLIEKLAADTVIHRDLGESLPHGK